MANNPSVDMKEIGPYVSDQYPPLFPPGVLGRHNTHATVADARLGLGLSRTTSHLVAMLQLCSMAQ